MRIVIPIATWQDKFSTRPFMVRISATLENGLDLDSAGNVLQVRSVSTERFVSRIGRIELDRLKELLAGLVICVEYDADAWSNPEVLLFSVPDVLAADFAGFDRGGSDRSLNQSIPR